MATLIAMSARVTGAKPPAARCCARTTGRGPGSLRFLAAPACSGQRMPTGAIVMHSVQIGRPHSEQERPVSRSGWR